MKIQNPEFVLNRILEGLESVSTSTLTFMGAPLHSEEIKRFATLILTQARELDYNETVIRRAAQTSKGAR